MRNIILSALLIAAIGNSVYADTLQSLPKKDVLELIEDHTLSSTAFSSEGQLTDNQFTVYYDKDGTMKGWYTKPAFRQPRKDVGTWMVKEDGSFCVTWDHWTNKKRNCLAVYAFKNGYIFINQDTRDFESLTLGKGIKKGDTSVQDVNASL